MRILITGAYGLVGGRLAKHLVAEGHQVILGSRANHLCAEWLPEATNVQLEWNSQASLESACESVDIIVHAAGLNAQDCKENIVQAFEVNASNIGRLILAAINARVKRIVYLSTAHVYANPLLGDITEKSCPYNLHPYASSNLAGEHIVLAADGIESIVLRLSNAFGAPTHKDADCWMLLMGDLCRQTIEHECITLKSDASQLRDFLTLADAVAAIEHCINISLESTKINIFNVAGENTLSILEMAKIIAGRAKVLFGYQPEIKELSVRSPFSDNLNISIEKLKSTGFSLQNPIQQEIDETLLFCHKYFKKLNL